VTIESNRSMGGLGALLTLFGAVGTILNVTTFAYQTSTASLTNSLWILGVSGIAGVLALVGFILFMVSMQGFSQDYGERKIFSNLIRGLIVSIVLGIIIIGAWVILWVLNVFNLFVSGTVSPTTSSANIQAMLTPYLGPLLPAMSIVGLIWIIHVYNAFNLLAEKSEVNQFHTAAKLFVLGALVNLAVGAVFAVLGVAGLIDYNAMVLVSVPGAFAQYVAWGFAAKGYYSIKPPAQTYKPQTYTTTPQAKYCMHCGAENQLDAVYCVRCGQQLQTPEEK